jgi:hypothetical protein
LSKLTDLARNGYDPPEIRHELCRLRDERDDVDEFYPVSRKRKGAPVGPCSDAASGCVDSTAGPGPVVCGQDQEAERARGPPAPPRLTFSGRILEFRV